jgi:glycosyltransferase involved in cell wall biosynthesis
MAGLMSSPWTRTPAARRILFLEPFYGGSHKDVADGLVAHSRHCIDLVTLPDRFWKWRLRGAALYWAHKIQSPHSYDGLLVSSLMSLADLKALWGPHCPPALVYFHENQFNYPLAPGEAMDYQFGFTNISTALAARRVLFNSHFHLQEFGEALPGFIRMMPDYRPNWVKPAIMEKAAVVYPGCHFAPDLAIDPVTDRRPPLIIWNHRWEHDKHPEAFFQALDSMQRQGIAFEVALLGQAYTNRPKIFEQARASLGDRIVQYGAAPSRQAYHHWLRRGTVVVSTARQENFGISVIEAMAHGCLPLLPSRLSYPEILPQELHPDFLYHTQTDLEGRLARLLTRFGDYDRQRRVLTTAMAVHAWPHAIAAFDRELDQLVQPVPLQGSAVHG